MTTAKEYREFANECLRWAAELNIGDEQQAFLDMARDWTLAAMRLEGILTADGKEADASPEIVPKAAGRQTSLR
jgi:hypothetical protein